MPPQTQNQSFFKHAIQALMLVAAIASSITSAQADPLGKARFRWEPVANAAVTGYKVHWSTRSGVYTHTVDAGNTTEIVIQEFTEGVEYFSAVTAYSATGDESDYSPELTFTYDSVDRMIFLEAEQGVVSAPMQVSGDGSISWVSAAAPDSAATATVEFSVP